MAERFEPAAVTIARLTEERDTALAKIAELRAKYERLKRALADDAEFVASCRATAAAVEAGNISGGLTAQEFAQRYLRR